METFTVVVHVKNMRTGEVCRRETVKFYSEFASTYKARQYAHCADVDKVVVFNNATGEVVYSSR